MKKERKFQLIIRNEKELEIFLKFKAKCATNDTNITRELIRLMEKYVKGEIK